MSRTLITDDSFAQRIILAGILQKLGHELDPPCMGKMLWGKLRQPARLHAVGQPHASHGRAPDARSLTSSEHHGTHHFACA